MTALMMAAKQKHFDTVQLLIAQGADVNRQDVWGCTALLLPELQEDPKTLAMLVQAGADMNKCNPAGRVNTLHSAASYSSAEVVEAFIKAHADIHQLNCYGMTPLQEAIKARNKNTVKVLIKAGSDLNRVGPDADALSPVETAVKFGAYEIAQELMNAGADYDAESLKRVSGDGYKIDGLIRFANAQRMSEIAIMARAQIHRLGELSPAHNAVQDRALLQFIASFNMK